MSLNAPDILLVEDNSATAELFLFAFKVNKSNIIIQIVHDGEAALDYLLGKDGSPDKMSIALPRLVLLDLHMPRLDGFQVLARLRADQRTQSLPVLIFSTSDLSLDKNEVHRLGANGYIHKPVMFKDMCATAIQLERDWLNPQSDTNIQYLMVGADNAQVVADDNTPVSTFADFFVGGGEMGAIMRAMDWSKTKLGPLENWPSSLKTMLGVVLGSRFPMLLWWGPELLHLYNDAYRPILRDKHPASLAAPAAQVWAEVWDVAGPMASSVLAGGTATWTEDLQLFINSGNMAEETYFTFSYSPVPGDDGQIGGLLNTVQETTVKVQSERQIRMLHELAERAAEAKSEDEAYRIAVTVLSGNELDLPFVLLYAVNETADCAQLVGASGWFEGEGRDMVASVPFSKAANSISWPFATVIQTAAEVIVGDVTRRFGSLPEGRWHGRVEQAIVLPLSLSNRSMPYALLVAGISPHRQLDERYRAFFRAIADQVTNVMANARAYEAEKKRAETLAELDRAKTTFFSNVSHEFRTPLTLILGLVEDAMAGSHTLSSEGLEVVHRNSIRLLQLVNSLLDFTRIEAGRLQLTFQSTDVAKLTFELAFTFSALIERAGMKLIVNCPQLPEPVYVDRAQWEKIVLNLLSNAYKFTYEGEIEVSLHWNDGQVELQVRDTGIGIPAHELPHLFERFHRVEQARGRSFEGTGIGLALVQDLVNLHGGTVRVSSVEGEGTTFTVVIPGGAAHLLPGQIVVGHDAPPAPVRISSYVLEASHWTSRNSANQSQVGMDTIGLAETKTEWSQSCSIADGHILLADDNEDMREYLCRLLSPHWNVEAVGDGLSALASVQENPPDLILSDVMMPRLDGFGLLRELRGNLQTRTIPVILLSARAGEEAMLEGLDYGADDYLAKPFTTSELLARVRTHLTMARARNEINAELARVNQELEAFSHSVAHDLRVPLRSIDGYSSMLLTEYDAILDTTARYYLGQVRNAAHTMGLMINDLLILSQVGRAELRCIPVNLSVLAEEILETLRRYEPDRHVHTEITPNLMVRGDPGLLRIMLNNLLGNAWKYTGRQPAALIALGVVMEAGETIYFIRDNGVGFDMKYAHKLFNAFQRLHTQDDFPGTGIGLVTVQRVLHRHAGRIWAKAAVDDGATFYFTLP
ncbi:ATP-binding protein [Chitinivorax sp. B]|uniref:ATP-binding protein n=1 Tax=Chitinivorax sp. B TaxID=2502235 RepID=UPI0010F7C385|nr:ATP-binding protein [Chitinivorax sp. B]